MASPRLPLSAFIICKDEASCIENCIRTLDACSEIVVVDSGSTDGTLAILARLQAEGWPIRLLRREWPGFALQKQFALEQCTQPWALNIDADERLDQELRDALPGLLDAPDELAGWRLPRRPYLIGYGYPPRVAIEGKLLRLVRRQKACYDLKLLVHGAILIHGEQKDAPRGTLLHHRIQPGDYARKAAQYASLKVRQRLLAGRHHSPLLIVLNPLIYFIRLYFFRRLFLCGLPGLIHSLYGSAYSFMVEAETYHRAIDPSRAENDDKKVLPGP